MLTDEPAAPRLTLVLAGVFIAVVVVGTADVVLDNPGSLLSVHIALEVIIVLVSLGAAVFLARGWYASEAKVARLGKTLEDRQRERDAWQTRARESLDSLGIAIDHQFHTWELTAAEREVAMLLLKGRGSKQIAAATGRSDRTIRQHAAAVYRKSGLNGRAELAAFFLESLFLPQTLATSVTLSNHTPATPPRRV